jgi:hypothetical protein
VLYFARVFAASFVVDTIRTLWVVPKIGARMAELLETPIMLVVTILAPRWTVLLLAVPSASSARLADGMHGSLPHAPVGLTMETRVPDLNGKFCCASEASSFKFWLLSTKMGQ